MKNAKHDNNQKFPKLGQWLTWGDKPGSVNKILIGLGLVCFILLCFDFLYPKHGHFDVENIRGFYSFYGFIAFTAVVFLAMFLRQLPNQSLILLKVYSDHLYYFGIAKSGVK